MAQRILSGLKIPFLPPNSTFLNQCVSRLQCFLLHHGQTEACHGYPLQYSCLEKFMDRGACWAMDHGVTSSRTQLKQLSTPVRLWALEHKSPLSKSACRFPSVCDLPTPSTCAPRAMWLVQRFTYTGNKTHAPPVRRVVKAFHFRKRPEPKFDHPQTFTRQVTMKNHANPEEEREPHADGPKRDPGRGGPTWHGAQAPARGRRGERSPLPPGPVQEAVMLLVDLGVLLVVRAEAGIIRGQDIHGAA